MTRRIVDAAIDVMARTGNGAPMREVAKAAGVSYGLVYKHFPNQEALLAAAIEREIQVVNGAWQAAQAIADPVERIVAICIAPLQPMSQIAGFRRTSAAAWQPSPSAIARLQESSALAVGYLRQAVREARKQGAFAGMPEDVLVVTLLGIPAVYLSEGLVPEEPSWERLFVDIGRLIRCMAFPQDADAGD